LSQPGVDVRVLIIDDASDDYTPQVGRELAREDWRVEFVRHTTNHPPHRDYNEGLEWATAEYTLLLSADDLLTPGALERAVRRQDRLRSRLTCGRQNYVSDHGPIVSAATAATCFVRGGRRPGVHRARLPLAAESGRHARPP